MPSNRPTRRKFLQQTGGALAGAALAGAISQRAYAGEDNTIKIALVGCGGRGNGAIHDALQTAGPTKLVAAADFFADKVQGCIKGLSRGPLAEQVDVPPERQFVGLDAYKKAIDAIGPGGVVLLGHAARLSADPPGICRGQGLPRVHGEVVRRRRAGHPPRAQGRRRSHEEGPQNRRRAPLPPRRAAGRGHRPDPKRPHRRSDHALGLSRSMVPWDSVPARRTSANWPTRSATTPATPGSTAVSSWIG